MCRGVKIDREIYIDIPIIYINGKYINTIYRYIIHLLNLYICIHMEDISPTDIVLMS